MRELAAKSPANNGNSGTTLDAFHRGNFFVLQPASGGHRSGMDAMMLAAAVPGDFSGLLADLGAGAGAAGLAVASRCPNASVVLVERVPEMAELARATVSQPENAHLRARARVLVADVALAGTARLDAGLADASFDFAILNPPFNEERDRQTPDSLKRDAHVMPPDLFESWIRTAAAIVKPRGGIALIARPRSLGDIIAAMSGRFGGCRIVPVLPHADRAAIRVIVRGVKGSRQPLSIEPPLVLRDAGGHAARADAVCNGQASLFGD